MSSVDELINAAFRESNIIPVGSSATEDERTEALQVLNRAVGASVGLVIGETLHDWRVPYDQTTSPVHANPPMLPGTGENAVAKEWPNNPPENSRVVWDGTDQSVFFPSRPCAGSQMALVLPVSAAGTIVLEGNGNAIEGSGSYSVSAADYTEELKWIYRPDLASWQPLKTVSLTDESPLPPDLDELLILSLAVRLAPRFGKKISVEAAGVYAEAQKSARTRYRQSAPAVGTPVISNTEQSFGSSIGWMV